MEDDTSKYLVKVETVQPNIFKSLFTVLKDNNIPEININFTPDGIYILEMNFTRDVLIHVSLDKDKFDSYYCKKQKKIGIDVINFTKIFKNIDSKDMLILFLEDPESPDNGINNNSLFGLLIDNSKKGQKSRYYIDTLDVNDSQFDIPELNYPYHIQLPSSDLQSIITQMKNVGGDVIKLLFHKDSLHFYTKGENGIVNITRSQTSKEDESIKIQKNLSENDILIIEIYVKLQRLLEFSKCSCLSSMATIYCKNDYPIFLEYDVGSLGFIHLILSPHTKPENW